MFQKYLLTLLITLTICLTGLGQGLKQTGGFARIAGMGANPYIIDPYFITVNPAWGSQYPNFLFGDLGASSGIGSPGNGQFVAANFHVGGGLTLGGMLSRNDFLGRSILQLDPFDIVDEINNQAGSNIINLNNNVELMGAIRAGNISFGFGVAYASTNREFNPAEGDGTIQSASQLGLNAGILARFSPGFRLDAGASFVFPSASLEPGDGTVDVSQTIILLNARLFIDVSSKLTFVPVVAFTTASGTLENSVIDPSEDTDLPSTSIFLVGAGANYTVGDFLLAGGVALASQTITEPEVEDVSPELSNSVFAFPIWNLGIEWNLTDWFVGRVGYSASTESNTNESESPSDPDEIDESIFTSFTRPLGATVGVGFRLGDFSLDAVVNEGILHEGLNNIGGAGPTFAYLSLAYALP